MVLSKKKEKDTFFDFKKKLFLILQRVYDLNLWEPLEGSLFFCFVFHSLERVECRKQEKKRNKISHLFSCIFSQRRNN